MKNGSHYTQFFRFVNNQGLAANCPRVRQDAEGWIVPGNGLGGLIDALQ